MMPQALATAGCIGDNASASPVCAVSYEALFSPGLVRVNAMLEKILSGQSPEGLWDALRYGTLGGGKRIRAILILESARACGGALETALPTACAVELVHAQSLIHDDLPCMDNDDWRRGKPTVHKAFGESTAVLAGDALLAMAFGLISQGTRRVDPAFPASLLLDIVDDLADAASVGGLVSGQFVDIAHEGQPYTAEVLEFIHTYKTGALFAFCARAGARLAQAPEPAIAALSVFGQKLGLAFQIVDDLLDRHTSRDVLGKTPGKDEAQQKATYPAYYGEAEARKRVDSLIDEALSGIGDAQGVAQMADGLMALARYVRERIH